MRRQPQPQPRHAPERTAHFTRNRVVVIAASLLAMLAAAVLVWLAMGTLSKDVDSAPMFPIKEVTFVGAMQRTNAAELERVAGGIRGSMLQTNLNDVKAAIKEVRWVRNADVRRRFPSTLEVTVEEHRPFAKWRDGDSEQGFLVNTFGEVFQAELDAPLPLFSGPEGTAKEMLSGYVTFRSQLAVVGQVPLAISLSPRRAWQIRLDNGVLLELGRSEAGERLARFVNAYPAVPALQFANVHVDMRYQSGMALRVAAGKAAMPTTDTARKPTKKVPAKS